MEDTEASALLMLTLGMEVMVVMDVVWLLITEVVHLTSDPLSGVLEERSVMLMLTLGMAVMVAMEVVLPLITEVVHLTSDPLSGVLEERSVMPMLMHSMAMEVMVVMDMVLLVITEVDTDSHTMPYLETLSSQDLPQLDIIQEEFLAVESAPLHHGEDGDMTTMLSLDIPSSDDQELDTIQEVFSAVK